MSTDGYVGVATDGPGKKIDTSEITRTDLTVVERQRIEVPALESAQGAAASAAVGPLVQGVVSDATTSVLDGKLAPLSITNDGRLRVSSAAATEDIEFFGNDMLSFTGEPGYSRSPWADW